MHLASRSVLVFSVLMVSVPRAAQARCPEWDTFREELSSRVYAEQLRSETAIRPLATALTLLLGIARRHHGLQEALQSFVLQSESTSDIEATRRTWDVLQPMVTQLLEEADLGAGIKEQLAEGFSFEGGTVNGAAASHLLFAIRSFHMINPRRRPDRIHTDRSTVPSICVASSRLDGFCLSVEPDRWVDYNMRELREGEWSAPVITCGLGTPHRCSYPSIRHQVGLTRSQLNYGMNHPSIGRLNTVSGQEGARVGQPDFFQRYYNREFSDRRIRAAVMRWQFEETRGMSQRRRRACLQAVRLSGFDNLGLGTGLDLGHLRSTGERRYRPRPRVFPSR